jgi:hypothetical protein
MVINILVIAGDKKSMSDCAPQVANTLESKSDCARLTHALPIAIAIARVAWFSRLGHLNVRNLDA